jgi:hypothetical protein
MKLVARMGIVETPEEKQALGRETDKVVKG